MVLIIRNLAHLQKGLRQFRKLSIATMRHPSYAQTDPNEQRVEPLLWGLILAQRDFSMFRPRLKVGNSFTGAVLHRVSEQETQSNRHDSVAKPNTSAWKYQEQRLHKAPATLLQLSATGDVGSSLRPEVLQKVCSQAKLPEGTQMEDRMTWTIDIILELVSKTHTSAGPG